MEEVIQFSNKKNERLFGIIHTPYKNASIKKKIGVNILNPGIKPRVAPHRLNVKIARKLCKEGFCVLRFDPAGIGDSDGEIPDGKKVEIWGKIQRGLFVEDIKISNDFFCKKYDIEELVLIGNCGGAISAILAAVDDRRVKKVVLIDVPIILMGAEYSFSDEIVKNNELIDKLLFGYIANLFKIASWKNLINGGTDFKAIKKIFKLKVKDKFKLLSKKEHYAESCMVEKSIKLNAAFFESFLKLVKNKIKILFITAGSDPGAETFRYYFKERYLKNGSEFLNEVETYTIENANHIYALTEWQEEIIKIICEYIKKHCCPK